MKEVLKNLCIGVPVVLLVLFIIVFPTTIFGNAYLFWLITVAVLLAIGFGLGAAIREKYDLW